MKIFFYKSKNARKNWRKKTVALVLAAGLLLGGMNGPAAGAAAVSSPDESGIMPCNQYSNTLATSFSISNKTAKMAGTVSGIPGVTTKIHIKLTLQKYSSGSWSKVVSYEKTVNDFDATLYKERSVTSGKYRVKGVYTVYKGTKSEQSTLYSSVQNC